MPMFRTILSPRQIAQCRRRAHERTVAQLTAGSKKRTKVGKKMTTRTKRELAAARRKRSADEAERILVTNQPDARFNGIYTRVYRRPKHGRGSAGAVIPPAGTLLMENLAVKEVSFRTKHNDALEADAAQDAEMNQSFVQHVSLALGAAMARGASGGKKYWWNPKLMTDDKLRFLSDEARRHGRYADAAVYLFMLDARGAGI